MKANRCATFLTLLAGLLFCLAINLSQAQLYVENFTNPSGYSAGTNSGSVGWSTYFATTTQATSLVTHTTLSSLLGDYTMIANATSSPATAGPGFLAFVTNTSTTGVFASVHTFTSSLTVANGTSINWIMGNNNSTSKIRLLIEIGSTWYASAATFSNTSSNTVASASTFYSTATAATNTYGLTFSTDAANWLSFTLDPSSGTMQLGTALSSNLTSNDISGIGFYAVDTTTSVVRLDTLTIVPEPATIALLGWSSLLLLYGSRRRFRSLS